MCLYEGADVNRHSHNNEEDTPLHTAARCGVPELVALYLAHGASVDAVNSLHETALMTAIFWAFDAKNQSYSEEHHLVCRLLLDHNAGESPHQQQDAFIYGRVCFRLHLPSVPDPNLKEDDYKTSLHKAAWNCDHVLIQMLLEAGADPRAMDINGCAPIQYLLKVTDVRPMAVPELCYQLLLNYNAARIYPPQFDKVQTQARVSSTIADWVLRKGSHAAIMCCFAAQVLQSCHNVPGAVEVLVNSYKRLKPTNKWRAAIPDYCYQVVTHHTRD